MHAFAINASCMVSLNPTITVAGTKTGQLVWFSPLCGLRGQVKAHTCMVMFLEPLRQDLLASGSEDDYTIAITNAVAVERRLSGHTGGVVH